MSYSKIPLVCQDYALTYQDVNKAQTNLDTAHDALTAQHGSGFAQTFRGVTQPLTPMDVAGRHNWPGICRAVAAVSPYGSSVAISLSTVQPSNYVIRSVTRLAAGAWLVEVNYLAVFYAHAVVGALDGNGNDITARANFARCLSNFASGNVPICVLVETRYLSSGTFVLGDMDFTLHIDGTVL